MKKIALILIITILPSLCFANGKVAAIKKGQRAPFDGILFDKRAEATITAKRESAVKVCEINKDYELKKLKAQCDFDKRFLAIEKTTAKSKHDSLMKIKNAEVKDEKALDKATNRMADFGLWVALCRHWSVHRYFTQQRRRENNDIQVQPT